MDVRLTKCESNDGEEGDEFQVEFNPSDKVYTVEDAVEACGFGWFQIRLSVFAGLIWMVDAMEIMVLAILAPEARCDYNLETWQEGLITTIVFAGMLLGAGLWGMFMDKFGRRKGLFIFCVFVSVMSLVSAFAPNYPLLVIFRGIVGFGIAGGAQAVTFYAEFLPVKSRAYCLIFIEVFFALGTFVEVLLALVVLGHFKLDWHWLLGFTAVPLFIDLLAFIFVPESIRYLVASNKMENATQVLEQIARINGKKLPEGRLVSKGEKEMIEMLALEQQSPCDDDGETDEDDRKSPTNDDTERLMNRASEKDEEVRQGNFLELFSSQERATTTVLLWIVWLTAAFGYYGVVLLTTEILDIIKEQNADSVNSTLFANTSGSYSSDVLQCTRVEHNRTDGQCKRLEFDDYIQVLWTTLAEFPGLLFTVLIIERIGRKKTLAVQFSLAVVFFFLMFICPIHKIVLMTLIFGARSALTGAFQAAYVYTPEVYPTSIRALGLGFCSSSARIGAMATPFVAEVLLRKTLRGGEGLYAAFCIVAAICSLLLPIETKGREL
ncbi:synaptic vesicle 2-related protein-like isoform X2 [Corticium candelabrum]|uniref:synaptic vesicle 2-related protein-like isoform X2 n=1 Tax=Corticium candelabrum TaxID=121492 RepID=UPI002E26C76D|nr:synaptic vesicle 2-related protein-like isoform X2 [Corticium candelabrum]